MRTTMTGFVPLLGLDVVRPVQTIAVVWSVQLPMQLNRDNTYHAQSG